MFHCDPSPCRPPPHPAQVLLVAVNVVLVADRGNSRLRALFLNSGIVVTLVGAGAVNLSGTSTSPIPAAGTGLDTAAKKTSSSSQQSQQQPGVIVLGPPADWVLQGPSGLALIGDGSGVFISEADNGRYIVVFIFVTMEPQCVHVNASSRPALAFSPSLSPLVLLFQDQLLLVHNGACVCSSWPR